VKTLLGIINSNLKNTTGLDLRRTLIIVVKCNVFLPDKLQYTTTSFPGTFPWLGGGAGKGLGLGLAREKSLGTRLSIQTWRNITKQDTRQNNKIQYNKTKQ